MKGIAGTIRWVMKGQSGVAATLQTLFFQVIIQATNILTGMITARSLGADGRGELASILLWPNLLGSVFALGIGPALLFNLKQDPEHQTELYSAALMMGTISSIVASALGVGLMPFLLSQYSTQTVLIAQFFVLTAPISLLTLIVLNAYKARNLFSVVNQTDYLVPVSTLGLLVGFTSIKILAPLTAAIAYRGPILVIFLWKFLDLWNHYRPRFRSLKPQIKQLLAYSWRSAPINILSQFADKIDQVLVVGYLTPTDMGLYVVALSVSRLLNIIQNSILSVLFPKAANKPILEVAEMAGRASRIGMTLSMLAAMGLIVFGAPVIYLYGGEKFLAAVPVFQILSIEIVLKGATLVLAQTFMAVGRPGVVSMLQGLGLGLSFPLMSFLIPRYGLIGAGVALLCSTSIRLLFILSCYPMMLKIRPPSLFPQVQDWIYLRNALSKRSSKT